MDRIVEYRKQIERVIDDDVELDKRRPIESSKMLTIFDEERNHYLLMRNGWKQQNRAQYVTLHVRLNDSKISIEEDWTEEGIVTEIVAAGIPKSDIVPGFQPPNMRPFTEFARDNQVERK